MQMVAPVGSFLRWKCVSIPTQAELLGRILLLYWTEALYFQNSYMLK